MPEEHRQESWLKELDESGTLSQTIWTQPWPTNPEDAFEKLDVDETILKSIAMSRSAWRFLENWIF